MSRIYFHGSKGVWVIEVLLLLPSSAHDVSFCIFPKFGQYIWCCTVSNTHIYLCLITHFHFICCCIAWLYTLHVFLRFLGSLKIEDDSDLIIELSPVDEVRERRHERHEHDRHQLKPMQKSVSANALTLLIQAPGSYCNVFSYWDT